MILRFKPNSEAEVEAKELIAHRNKTLEYAKDIVEEIIGKRPFSFGYHWFFGISYSWSHKMIGFKDIDDTDINGLKFTEIQEDLKVFTSNKKTKAGKLLAKRFQDEQTKLRTDIKPLNKFGIYAYKDEELRYFNWNIGEDEKGIWIALPNSAFEFITPHPDVRLETEIPTTKHQD